MGNEQSSGGHGSTEGSQSGLLKGGIISEEIFNSVLISKMNQITAPQLFTLGIKEGNLEAKTECYGKDKLKSLPFLRSFYDDF